MLITFDAVYIIYLQGNFIGTAA